jgi:protoporphyrinogen/coproporphyrinogen III oxidase
LLYLLLFKKKNVKSAKGDKNILFYSFPPGMGAITQRISEKYPESLCLDTEVTAVEYDGQYHLKLKDAQIPGISCKKLILTTPLPYTSQILSQQYPHLSSFLKKIPYAPIITVSLAFKREEVGHSLRGFGFLCPRQESQILGAMFISSLFPERCPADQVMLHVYLGGVQHPEMMEWSDDKLLETTLKELGRYLNIQGKPQFTHLHKITYAIPQYQKGHGKIVEELQKELEKYLGLYLAGNFWHGVSVNASIKNAQEISQRLR